MSDYKVVFEDGTELSGDEIENGGLSFKGMTKEEAKKRFLELGDRLQERMENALKQERIVVDTSGKNEEETLQILLDMSKKLNEK